MRLICVIITDDLLQLLQHSCWHQVEAVGRQSSANQMRRGIVHEEYWFAVKLLTRLDRIFVCGTQRYADGLCSVTFLSHRVQHTHCSHTMVFGTQSGVYGAWTSRTFLKGRIHCVICLSYIVDVWAQWSHAGFVTGQSRVQIPLCTLESLRSSYEQGIYIQLL